MLRRALSLNRHFTPAPDPKTGMIGGIPCSYHHDMSSSYFKKCFLNYEAWILMGHEFMEMKNTPAAACLEVE